MTRPYTHLFKEIRNIDKFRCPACNKNCGLIWNGPRGKVIGSFDTAKSGCDGAIIYLDEDSGKYYAKEVYYPRNAFEALYRKRENDGDSEEIDRSQESFFYTYKLPCNHCKKSGRCPAEGLRNHLCLNHDLK